jgi:hypothetical protein
LKHILPEIDFICDRVQPPVIYQAKVADIFSKRQDVGDGCLGKNRQG